MTEAPARDLRALRKERRLTVEDLALASGVSAAWLFKLEKHQAALTEAIADRLAPLLGVPADALITAHVAGRARRRRELAGRLGAAR